jgi:TRAP-type C4-dicarboxylate transport system permease small subunit
MADEAGKNLFDRIVVGAFSIVLVVNSLALTLIITGAALSRYVFKVNFTGYDEIVVIVAFWFYFMGSAYGSYNNSHVTADLVDAYFPEGTGKRVMHVIRWFVTSAACGLFAYYGYRYFMFSFKGPLGTFIMQPKTMIWRIPHWIAHLSIFSGLVLMEYYFLRNLLQSIRLLVSKGEAA